MPTYPEVVKETVWGHEFPFVVADARSRDWYVGQNGPSKAAQKMAHLGNFLREGDRVIDCGANEGYYAVAMALAVGPRGRVLAVEPDDTNRHVLEANIRLNHLAARVLSVGAALAAETGTVRFAAERVVGGAGIWTPAITLDELRWFEPTFLKIDVEGYEVAVLRGARQTLRLRPRLEIEVHLEADTGGVDLRHYGDAPEDLLCLLWEHDYTVTPAGSDEPLREAGELRTGHYHCR